MTTPGMLRQFAQQERRGAEVCRSIAHRAIPRLLKIYFSKSAADHEEQAESVEEFLNGDYHNAART